jgi:hypothetical protein
MTNPRGIAFEFGPLQDWTIGNSQRYLLDCRLIGNWRCMGGMGNMRPSINYAYSVNHGVAYECGKRWCVDAHVVQHICCVVHRYQFFNRWESVRDCDRKSHGDYYLQRSLLDGIGKCDCRRWAAPNGVSFSKPDNNRAWRLLDAHLVINQCRVLHRNEFLYRRGCFR